PSAVDLAHELVLGHLHVVEEGLAKRAVAADQQDRLGRDARRLHVEQYDGVAAVPVVLVDAVAAVSLVVSLGVGGPDLLAVDDPVIALVLAERLQRDEVAARSRLRIALAPADFAAGDLVEILLLLFLGAEVEQRRAEHPDAEAGERRARADPR